MIETLVVAPQRLLMHGWETKIALLNKLDFSERLHKSLLPYPSSAPDCQRSIMTVT
jgi:hypothetical protein